MDLISFFHYVSEALTYEDINVQKTLVLVFFFNQLSQACATCRLQNKILWPANICECEIHNDLLETLLW